MGILYKGAQTGTSSAATDQGQASDSTGTNNGTNAVQQPTSDASSGTGGTTLAQPSANQQDDGPADGKTGLGSVGPKVEVAENQNLPETPTNHIPTASDVGIDPNDDSDLTDRQKAAAAVTQDTAVQRAVSAGVSGPADNIVKVYSSHPIQNFAIGRFRFEKSVLTLTKQEDADEFEKLLADIPAPDRLMVKELDLQAAETLVKNREQSATKQFDSSVGRQALEQLKAAAPTVGSVPLEFAATQGDNNRPILGGATQALDEALGSKSETGGDNS